MRIIYLTTRNAAEAKRISHDLLKKRIVACTNIFPIESMYWWDNEIQEDVEFVILAKTDDDSYDAVEKAIIDMHEYEIPAIYSWKPDRVSKDYDAWIKKQIKNK